MAKKKTASKKAPKSLRQAVMEFKTAIINFSSDHQLFIAYNPDSGETYIADEPAQLQSNFILGEESGSSITPVITFTAVNDTEGDLYFSTPPYSVENSNVKELSYSYTVPTNSSDTIDLLGVGILDDDNYVFGCSAMSGDYSGEITASNAVNCTYDDNNNRIIVTDPGANASITITYHNYQ